MTGLVTGKGESTKTEQGVWLDEGGRRERLQKFVARVRNSERCRENK
jgi:hypothetical protein